MREISEMQRILQERDYWLLDGAIGTELEFRGYRTHLPFWTAYAVRDCPDLLQQIYQEYLDSGSTILTTNTFRISYYLFEKAARMKEFEPLFSATCDLTRGCVQDKDCLVAGSIAPLEDCYRPDLVPSIQVLVKFHTYQLEAFQRSAVDFILAETINSVREATVLMRLTFNLKIPLILSLVTNGKGQLLSGEPLEELIPSLEAFSPVGLSINCRSLLDMSFDAQKLSLIYPGFKGLYANAPGLPHPTKGWETTGTACDDLAIFASRSYEWGYKIFGGCCGTTPKMILAIDHSLKAKKNRLPKVER